MRIVLYFSRLFISSSLIRLIRVHVSANSFVSSHFSASTYSGILPMKITSPPALRKFLRASRVVLRIVERLGTITTSYVISPTENPLSVFLYWEGRSASQTKSKSIPPHISVLVVSQKMLSLSRSVIAERSFGP